MFKRHEFTCPDVIYMRNRAKRNSKIALAFNAVVIIGMWAYGKKLTDDLNKTIDESPVTTEA